MKKVLAAILMIIFICAVFIIRQDSKTTDSTDYFEDFMKKETDTAGFLKAVDKIKFQFPRDHGIHEGFQTEWWYFTGNLKTDDNKKFGYQFTIFRSQLKPKQEKRNASFAANAVYMAHLALTDAENKKFYYFDKFSRENEKNTFVKLNPFRAEIDGWKVFENDNDFQKLENLKIMAKEQNIELELDLKIVKPFVFQGDEGLSQKGKGTGNASYYYSATRISTKGTIKINKNEYIVSGNSWLDREWSTSALSENQEGWDWFSIQLDDFSEIMFYNLRLKSGQKDPLSKGVIVFENGNYKKLDADDFIIEIKDRWESPRGGVYPSKWKVKIPKYKIELELKPLIKDQELNFFIRYFEGAVSVEGLKNGNKISGAGYVELTGYAKDL
ncbi:MAG: lipocalin-like domain-containing protein [Desulfobacteraceae bacterium]